MQKLTVEEAKELAYKETCFLLDDLKREITQAYEQNSGPFESLVMDHYNIVRFTLEMHETVINESITHCLDPEAKAFWKQSRLKQEEMFYDFRAKLRNENSELFRELRKKGRSRAAANPNAAQDTFNAGKQWRAYTENT